MTAALTFEQAKEQREFLDAAVRHAGAAIKAVVGDARGPMGLTPDHIKFSPEYRAAKAAYDRAFARLRQFNGWYAKAFAKEIRAEHRAKRHLTPS